MIKDYILPALLLLIIVFVLSNMYTDLKDYFYTKNLGIFDMLTKNKIII